MSEVDPETTARVAAANTPEPGWARRGLAFFNANGVARDLVIGLLLVLAGFGTAFWLENRIAHQQQMIEAQRADRAEVLENTRFVRDLAVSPDVRGLPLRGLNLQSADLAGLDLSCRRNGICANLGSADLSGANLFLAILYGADLTDADLSGATLYGADLTEADLTEATITGADLTEADLTKAHLYKATMTGANLKGANLKGATLTGADLTGADLTDADLSGANLFRADLTDALLHNVCYDKDTFWGGDWTAPQNGDCGRGW